MPERFDVAILGGGLAGLTLALQIKRARPETKIVVTEKRSGPAPEAAFKVGESTVEPGAHYFGDVLGLRDHIESEQLRKFGLRFFCPAGSNDDVSRRVEIGPPFHMPVPSYQLDRGRFENELGRRVEAAGVDLRGGLFADSVELSEDGDHLITCKQWDAPDTLISSRWVVDATGRGSLMKKTLHLWEDVPHKINSSWFRLEGGMDIEDFSDDEGWLGRMQERGLRQYSTNHMMGDGYWVWLINLSSGPISIGVCADPRRHPFAEMDTLEKTVDWLRNHEPQIAAVVDERGLDKVDDFLTVQSFSLGCKQVFSDDRWAVTGEAGCFLDPLCSPGSDFIAYSNSLIADIVTRSLDGEDVEERTQVFNDFYRFAVETVMKVYTDAYPIMGNALVFVPKFIFNAILYWGVWSLLFFKDKMWDLEFIKAIQPDLDRIGQIYTRTEDVFRSWHALENGGDWQDLWVSPPTVAPLAERVRDLAVPRDDAALRQRFSDNVKVYEALAVVMFDRAARAVPQAPPREGKRINPYAISLNPGQWEQDGVFDGSGMTVDEAKAMLPGIEHVWLDERVAATA